MKNIRAQAKVMGHTVVGALKRLPDEEYKLHGEEWTARVYVDSEGVTYWVDWRGDLMTIAGEDWCI